LSVNGVAGVLVISRDRAVLSLAEELGARSLLETPVNGVTGEWGQDEGEERGLNRAIAQAATFVQDQKGDALLFLPTDLPLLQVDDIHSIVLAWDQRRNCIVIAPSYNGGTNALLLAPPDAAPPAFGLDSFARHMRLAEENGLCVQVVESSALAWDVDTPEQYRLMAALS